MADPEDSDTSKGNRRRRCLACGSRFATEANVESPRRCPVCARTNKPIDRLMRWIWQDLDEQARRGAV